MMKYTVRFGFVTLLLTTTACTQPAAQIDLRGQQSFTRSGASTNGNYASSPAVSSYHGSSYSPPPVYTSTRPVSQETEQSARVDSIGVSDLTPPAKAAKTAPQPAVISEKKTDTPINTPINGWTKKPHGSSDIAVKEESSIAPVQPQKTLVAAENTKNFIWPVSGKKLLTNFGPKGTGKASDGISIASAEGQPVWAAADGEVVYVGNELNGYGNMIMVKHAENKTTNYAHLSRATVNKDEHVKQGDIIGYVGSTGNVKTPQLYFAVHDGKDAVDPKKYLTSQVAGL